MSVNKTIVDDDGNVWQHKLDLNNAKTLRDEFAMAAMQGLLAKYGHSESPTRLASLSLSYADEMLAERNRNDS